MRANCGLVCAGLIQLLLAGSTLAQSYSVIKHFNGSDGQGPGGTLVLSSGVLYGTTYMGGISNAGTIFKLGTNGADFATLQTFLGALHHDGGYPLSKLLLSGGTLYGTTQAGGSGGVGTVYKISTAGTGFAVIHSISTAENGYEPRAGLALLGNTLFGTVYGRPAPPASLYSGGGIFRVNTDSSGWAPVLNFSMGLPTGPQNPYSGLTIAGSTLFVSTFYGGLNNLGTLYKVNTNLTGAGILKDFAGSDGANPRGDLLRSGSILYGVTQSGGISNLGTIFRITTNGTGFTVLKHFTGADGANPVSTLLLLNNTLYGTTYAGGQSNLGTIFRLSTNGTDFVVLKHFTGVDGANSFSGLVASGATIYGTTGLGGSSDKGVVFSLSLAPRLSIEPRGSHYVLEWTAIEGLPYQIQSCNPPGLTNGNWTPLGPPLIATNSTMTVSNLIEPDSPRFFRLAIPQ